jgi:ketosteroid isomerase-like protein
MDTAPIRRIIGQRAIAIQSGDIDAVMKDVADEVVIFDVVDPLQRQGKAASRARAQEWTSSYDGPITWENRDLTIVADGNVAFSHTLSRVQGTLKTGAKIDMWFRSTLGFRKVGGHWMIVHDHGSVPFNPASGKPSMGLKP